MKNIQRRELLVTAGIGTALTTVGAGCLDQGAGTNRPDDETDETGDPDTEGECERTLLERWVPASSSSKLLFHYRDRSAFRQYEDALQADVVASVPTMPAGPSSDVIEDVAGGEPAVDAVCRFGSEGVVGNVVVSGSFDPGAVDAELESAIGAFELFEHDAGSVAVSTEMVVVSPADGAALETILEAGVEGTDRRINASDGFARLADRVGDRTIF
ncbi:hypothetical protein [Natronorubrum aibiense]|uniref:hypothetical protein n=1 Tax=Natronorubrum aibiense TaxID=348826 RepID=UPI001D03994A|nr:hypothetical protein [Natronorubrum aibiense]